jgi:hypothetical protein
VRTKNDGEFKLVVVNLSVSGNNYRDGLKTEFLGVLLFPKPSKRKKQCCLI